jgi:hypothetical protein
MSMGRFSNFMSHIFSLFNGGHGLLGLNSTLTPGVTAQNFQRYERKEHVAG